MPRALVIGNGRMLINFDARLAMRDLYYPHVGMMNQIGGHRVATGVWADGRFSWLDGPGWSRELDYEDETLVTDVVAHNPELEIELQIHDAVHVREDLYLKRMVVSNRANRRREVRLFFTHDFSIDLTDIGDTVLYDLSVDAMMHYKRDTCLLMSGQTSQGGIFQYATGTKRFGGAEGTWRDAEDGWLEGNPIAQGSVDSVFSLKLVLDGGEHEALHYWIAAGSRFEDVRQLHARVLRVGLESLLEETRAYWRSWV
ncbi:MAG TPA: glycoside hydrolase family 15 protein, partial [Limnochordia bacterium]|nr:glycoside hydrolase family 15 protein [Limnochordia bacterium]